VISGDETPVPDENNVPMLYLSPSGDIRFFPEPNEPAILRIYSVTRNLLFTSKRQQPLLASGFT